MLLDVNWSSILLYSPSLLLRIVFSTFTISNPNPNINIIPHSLDHLRKKKLIFIRINKFCLNIYQTSRNLSVDYPQSLKFTLFYWSLCFACFVFTLMLYRDMYILYFRGSVSSLGTIYWRMDCYVFCMVRLKIAEEDFDSKNIRNKMVV